MEAKNRNIWIAVIVIAVVCCCCVAAVAAGALGWFIARVDEVQTDFNLDIFDSDTRFDAQLDETFEVGQSPSLEIENFAGNVSVRAGEDNTIHVMATKRSTRSSVLDEISVSMSQQGDRVVVRTKKTDNWPSARVDLEITAPAGTELDLNTGAGNVDLRDMTGSVRAHSGAGNIDARGAAGPMRLGTGAGNVWYEGTPAGQCRFESGAGEITLRLGANPDVRVDLGTGLGSINLGYHVDGQTSARDVNGVIGDGDQGSIYAHTGLGSISVRP